jgi:hypothetical protein
MFSPRNIDDEKNNNNHDIPSSQNNSQIMAKSIHNFK